MADLVDSFFEELGQRGHDPLLDRLRGTGRFEVTDGGRADRWLVTVRGGHVMVSRGEGDANWMMSVDRATLNHIITGDTSTLAALMQGTLNLRIEDTSQRLGLLARLFGGPPESRG